VFAIEVKFPDGAASMPGAPAEAVGRIVIGDFEETLKIPLGFWGAAEYRQSWRRAFDVIRDNPHSMSCLMVAMTNPEDSNFLECWPMYRDGNFVYIQNSLIFLDELNLRFSTEEPWASLGPRREFDEYGNKISEWKICIESLEDFFR
jgi:hypothetical protein